MSTTLTVQTARTTLAVELPETTLELSIPTRAPVQVAVVGGAPGPQGPVGPPGVADITVAAGAAIGALKAVRIATSGQAELADKNSNPEVVGLTITAAASGDDIDVRLGGPVVDLSWNWAEGPVWLGSAGTLTQTPPTTGHLVVVGRSAGPTRLIVDPEFIATLN